MTNAEKIAVLQAYEDGQEIEYSQKVGESLWMGVKKPEFDFTMFNYRIKPAKQYKPYEKVDEAWLGKKIRSTKDPKRITIINDIIGEVIYIDRQAYSAIEMLEYWVDIDGEPFGEEV